MTETTLPQAADSGARVPRVVLLTGDGKGKSSSALGMALRAVGHGMRVVFIQFVKGLQTTGEARALRSLPGVELLVCGRGFVRAPTAGELAAHRRAALEGLAYARERLRDAACEMVVLDEICAALSLELLQVAEVREALATAAPGKIIILTGRDAPEELIDLADTVSVITNRRHAYQLGRAAQAGVEW